jgi:hypothetical protein
MWTDLSMVQIQSHALHVKYSPQLDICRKCAQPKWGYALNPRLMAQMEGINAGYMTLSAQVVVTSPCTKFRLFRDQLDLHV